MNFSTKCVVMMLGAAPVMLAQTSYNDDNHRTQASATSSVTTGQTTGITLAPLAAVTDLGVLRDGTPVRIRLARTLSSEQVKTGDQIDFDVLEDIDVENRVVIPRGSKAIGSITEAEHKRRMGRGGKLNFVLEYVRLEDGTKVALRAERNTSGGGHVGAMSAGIVASLALGFGLPAPLFLLMHGKDAVVPEGTLMTAFVDGDVRLHVPVVIAAVR
jgi:hypothetical protein